MELFVDGKKIATTKSVTVERSKENRIMHYHDGTSINLSRLDKMCHIKLLKG